MVLVAVPFAALQIGGSPTAVGLVFAAGLIPRIALMLVGGVWADRLPRQHVMIAADLVRATGQAAGAFVLLTGVAELWQLALIAAIHGAGAAFFTPAASGFIPETVSAPRLQQANALIGISRNVFAIVGPALAGLLVYAFGPGWVYAIDAGTFAVSASFLVRLPAGPAAPAARKKFMADLADGFLPAARGEREGPSAFGIENRREDARRVEVRQAEPVDRPVRPDERHRVEVADDAVLGDRQVRVHGQP